MREADLNSERPPSTCLLSPKGRVYGLDFDTFAHTFSYSSSNQGSRAFVSAKLGETNIRRKGTPPYWQMGAIVAIGLEKDQARDMGRSIQIWHQRSRSPNPSIGHLRLVCGRPRDHRVPSAVEGWAQKGASQARGTSPLNPIPSSPGLSRGLGSFKGIKAETSESGHH
jgi:hypothetical protein